MSTKLVIVESPAKAKIIGRYLGKGYVVHSSVGHIRDLPSSGTGRRARSSRTSASSAQPASKWEWASKAQERLVARMGVDPYHDWTATYEVPQEKRVVAKELQKLAAHVEEVYLATDLDREGEAIAWHLRELLGGDAARYKRVTFNAITKDSIGQAFRNPGQINMDRVEAQQTRRFLDRVVGFMLSPLLWEKVAKRLSAGRVQTPAVRLVAEREIEIRNFTPNFYWELWVCLGANDLDPGLKLKVQSKSGKSFKPCEETVSEESEALQASEPVVVKKDVRTRAVAPPPPFVTSTLQQAASTELKFGVKRTMSLAQRLYEHGFITYMRTDSTQVSEEALQAVRARIVELFGAPYCPGAPRQFAKRAQAQEAHEAIRPARLEVAAEEVGQSLGAAEAKLYSMILKRFLASQMAEAQVEQLKWVVQAGPYELRYVGRRIRFEGWMKLFPPDSPDFRKPLPDWVKGDRLYVHEILPKQCSTRPPGRYSEARLVRELERRGIGRPSTYAAIVENIQKRGYVRLEKGRFFAEKLGEVVSSRLCAQFREIMSYDFTAQMENRLDEVARGEKPWKAVLNEFFQPFEAQVHRAALPGDQGGMLPVGSTPIPQMHCAACGGRMELRLGSFGLFLGCSAYSGQNPCRHTLPLKPVSGFDDSMSEEEGETASDPPCNKEATFKAVPVELRPKCSVCGSGLDRYRIQSGGELLLCGRSPECPGYQLEASLAQSAPAPDSLSLPCDQCEGGCLQMREGRFGSYLACNACKATRKLLPSEGGFRVPPPPLPLPELPSLRDPGGFLVLREGKAGLFLAANNFPKVRECRAPSIEELQRFQNRLPSEWARYAQGPLKDEEGNPTYLRYHRKAKMHCIGSQRAGKWTQFIYWYPETQNASSSDV